LGVKADTTDELLTGLFALGRKGDAAIVDEATRARCGQDLRSTIAQGRLDGTEEEGVCPSCGNRFTFLYRRPDAE
jgi:hypothetical protein